MAELKASPEVHAAMRSAGTSSSTLADPMAPLPKKLQAKIDFRVVPCLFALFFLAFLDKVNISNAATLGMKEDLRLKGNELNTAIVIFFVPYVILEIPANIIMKKVRPHVWFSATIFAFGVVSMCQGFVHNYGALLAVRFLLGIAECGTFPGCFYLMSMWYTRGQSQKRFTAYCQSTSIAGAFGGLLAAAIFKMDGIGGYAGWRWIFILEGLFTAVFAVVAFFCVPDFPEDAKWLTGEERILVISRLRAEQGASGADRPFKKQDFIDFFSDWKVWVITLAYFCILIPAYGYAYFAPTIIKQFGYSPIQTQLHSVPPWACVLVLAIILAYFSDRIQQRYVFTLVTLLCIAGLSMLLTIHHNIRARYAALFLVALGTWSAIPIIICWFTMNMGGHHRRAIGTAFLIGLGNASGIPAPYLFISTAAPRYTTGLSVGIAMTVVSMMGFAAYLVGCIIANRSKAAMRKPGDDTDSDSESAKGDLRLSYRYVY